MTILILGYVCVVALSAYFISRLKSSNTELEFRLANFKRWLDAANEDQFAKGDALRAAYKTIDRYEEILRDKYNHWDDNQSLPEDAHCCLEIDEQELADFAAELGASIDDTCACAGMYYDEYGNLDMDKLDWTPQDGVTYSESDDSDV